MYKRIYKYIYKLINYKIIIERCSKKVIVYIEFLLLGLGITKQFFREKCFFDRLFPLTQADVTFDTSEISYSKKSGLAEGTVKHETKVRLKHACP